MKDKNDLAPEAVKVIQEVNKAQEENDSNKKQEEEEWQQPETASECYLMALERKKFTDVVFTFENSEDHVEAHLAILQLRSPVDWSTFKGQGGSTDRKTEIKVKDSTPQRFREFLQFLYVDKFDVNIAGALDLLQLAEKYNVRPLINKCEQLFKTEIKPDEAVEIFETARKYGNTELEKKAGYVMSKSLAVLSQKESFLDIQEETLIFLLGRDELTLEEVDLFKLVVEWGKKKLEMNPERDESLKKVLTNVIPLIRFPVMSPNDFYLEVVPHNILSEAEMLTIYSYFAWCATNKTSPSPSSPPLTFSTQPRNTGNTEWSLDFYQKATDNLGLAENGSNPVKECIRFSVDYGGTLPVGAGVWVGFSFKRPAIRGIYIHYPIRDITGTSLGDSDAVEFKFTVTWGVGTGNIQSVRGTFELAVKVTKKESDIILDVDPAIELVDGFTYCITLEDQSLHFAHQARDMKTKTKFDVQYTYKQKNVAPGVIKPEYGLDLKSWPFKLTNIQRDTNYENVRLIQGLRVGLV